MSAREANTLNNRSINNNALRALGHLNDALNSLQNLDYATSTATLMLRFYWDAIKPELDRLWEGSAHD